MTALEIFHVCVCVCVALFTTLSLAELIIVDSVKS